MNDETKVGIFVLAGLALLGIAVFLLGDYSFKSYYPISVEFQDVAGLPNKSVVKLSGVDIGKIKDITLKGEGVVVELAILKGVKIFRGSKFLIGSTSLIGSKFLQIDQGSASSGVVGPGETVKGSAILPIDRAMAAALDDIQGMVKEFRGDGSTARNLNKILENLKETTSAINNIVANSGSHAQNAIARMDSITEKLDSFLTRADALMAKVETGEGVAGALVSDKKMKEDVSSTLDNLKTASASVREVLNRVNKYRTYWYWQTRYEPAIASGKTNIGVKITPNENRYYYLGASNLWNAKNKQGGVDYEINNTVDALLGWKLSAFELYTGVMRGSAGVGAKYRPFNGNTKLDHFRFLAEVNEFARNRYIKNRHFNDPAVDVGFDVLLGRFVSIGASVSDILELKRVNYTASVSFEDKDISYLLGLAAFGSSGSKK